jgi:YD repeat-containing protein
LSYDLPRGVILEQGESEMKDSKRNTTFLVALIAGLAFFTSLGAASESKGDLSDKDEDAFILYKYSLIDAKKNLSSKISESTEGNETTYEYDGHALSCRTVMTGSITKTTLEDRTHVVGEFDVSNNSYGITRLSFDFYDEGSKTRTGTMTVNDKVIDIKHFDRQ